MANERAPRPILAIVATVVWGILAVPGFLIAVAGAPMAFDAPGSDANPLVWLIVFAFLAFPVACVISIAASWITWRMPKVRVAMACIPLLPIVTLVAIMGVSSPNPFGPMQETRIPSESSR